MSAVREPMPATDVPSRSSGVLAAAVLPGWLMFTGMIVADALAIILAFEVAAVAYHGIGPGGLRYLDARLANAFTVGAVAAVFFTLLASSRGHYSLNALSGERRQYHLVAQCWLFSVLAIGWVAFLTKSTDDFSRGAITIGCIVAILFLVVARSIYVPILSRRLNSGRLAVRRAYVVQLGRDGRYELGDGVMAGGIKIVGRSVLNEDHLSDRRWDEVLSDTVRDAMAALSRAEFDAVYLFFPWHKGAELRQLRTHLRAIPKPVYLFEDPCFEHLMTGSRLDVGEARAYEIQSPPLATSQLVAKRLLDIVLAGLALVFLSPLLLLIGAAVYFESGGPVIFRQTRNGFAGQPFTIYKFRTMTVCENGNVIRQAERRDTRVTRLGRILRAASIDELPQLFNVLIGDMSMVGPRPHAVAHDNYYDDVIASYAFRRHVKPGITGWAQVEGWRGETREVGQMRSRVERDLWYIDNWSILLDLRILIRTGLVLFFQKNAY